MKPSARIFCTSAGLLAVTVSSTPFGRVDVRTVQPIHSVYVAGMLGHHALDRLQRAGAARHLDAQAVINRLLLCCRSHRHFVHVDQMLPQGIDISLGPVGLWIGLQLSDDLLNRTERGDRVAWGFSLAWLMPHHAAHRMMHRH